MCRVDAKLDRLPLTAALWTSNPDENISEEASASSGKLRINEHQFKRIDELQRLIKSISTTSTPSSPLSSASKVLSVLQDAGLSSTCTRCQWQTAESGVDINREPDYEHELEWLLLSKATTQAYGAVLNSILKQTLQVNDHIWYWDDILSSHRWATVYSLQTSPLRFWSGAKTVWQGIKMRGGVQTQLSAGWAQFYGVVQDSIREQSVTKMRSRVLSPLAQVQAEARKKQAYLKQLKDVSANALGVLLGEGLDFDSIPESPAGEEELSAKDSSTTKVKSSVAKSIALLEAVLVNVKDPEPDVDTFEDRISENTSEDVYFTFDKATSLEAGKDLRPDEVGVRLQKVLTDFLPQNNVVFDDRLREYGRPSALLRYWLPATAILLSSSTILRIAVNHKAELIEWVRNIGQTTLDFWNNWVVEPTRKIIGTIRHDEGSEVAIMSKRSLEGDRESLERMVVDFAVQNPSSGSLSEPQLADIRAKVREGDLTPVLMAYEKDMQSPFIGAIKGNLIRALLIQIQKTKVDVEVAMGGIDSILKSQELVFGFVSLTPGIIVTVAVARYMGGVFGTRQFRNDSKKQGQMLAVLRYVPPYIFVLQFVSQC